MESRRQRRLDKRKNAKEIRKRKLRDFGKEASRKTAAVLVAFLMLLGAVLTAPTRDAEALTPYAGRSALTAAYGLYGTPYVYNGYWYTSYGIDCSELTMLAYRGVGVSLPDDPYRQMQMGYWVSTPRAGDLVFFSEDYSGYPTHVGIATGRGTIVHASSYTGNVTETWIGYLDGYIGAKRI